jgi:hypothetical protein
VRVIILNRIDEHPRNAPWEVFASEQDRIRAGLLHYRARYHHRQRDGHWALLERLYLIHSRENPEMAYTMEDFLRETHELVLANMTPEERLKGLEPEDRLKGLQPEERLKGLEPEERLKGLEPEERLKGLEPEEVLRALDPAVIEAWLAKQRQDH